MLAESPCPSTRWLVSFPALNPGPPYEGGHGARVWERDDADAAAVRGFEVVTALTNGVDFLITAAVLYAKCSNHHVWEPTLPQCHSFIQKVTSVRLLRYQQGIYICY